MVSSSNIGEVLAELRRGLEVELAPERQRHQRVLARDVHGQARWVELGLGMHGGRGDLRQPLEPRRQVPTRSPVAERLHARRQEHGADDRRVHEHGGRQHDAHRLDVEGAQRPND
jgi:hypothetical protein